MSSFSFKSIGHALASGLHDAYIGAMAVEKFLVRVNTPTNEALVIGVTSLVPNVGPAAAAVERAVFAVGGEVAALLQDATGNGKAQLLQAGFAETVINDFEALIKSVPGLFLGLPKPANAATPNPNSPLNPQVPPAVPTAAANTGVPNVAATSL